ncbi:hypothetical protein HBI24_174190 [Parastagonospora nodorum]|nr:hypothetical protein HBH49_166800 [Parastagonospora nodorum]KAH4187101.1 hypothetical protein HBH42_163100 [Parastagonospora nodorum]KAH4220105.1 hypothetical protein HBI06_179720 [Parastagonospora nodorum]KAH4227481.1 hypothetical protein HBI05_213350 [Parastagonospora nodorum]KAH5063679.1 hypothetical protein HBH95_221050 [Parastagonospora nodorum]
MPSNTSAPTALTCEEEGDESDLQLMPHIPHVRGLKFAATRHESPEPSGFGSAIRTGHDQGAQVVAVDHDVVAKISDPLFYPDVDEYGFRPDVVCVADGAYARGYCFRGTIGIS